MKQLSIAENKWNGYVGYLLEYVEQAQLLDEALWKLFVKQYREQNDIDNGWRGEYWGKMMRGATLTYRCTGNERLYACMENTVRDLLSVQEADGRISSYPRDKEFDGWDMWCRKYVLLGNLYFYEICKNEALKAVILKALSSHLDYIIAHIGKEENKKSIFATSRHYGCLNSCSILEPVVKLYNLTGKKSYFDFAKYIVDGGFCSDMNLIEECLQKTKYPYQFAHTKAYEMMSCFQGLLEYYEVTGEEKYFTAAKNFVDMVHESDITIIGCAGCLGEFFDNSANTQTKPYEGEMQETCVTVTWMNLCYKLLQMTNEVKYADWMECSALNAMGGAVNTENQKAARAHVVDGATGKVFTGKRGILPFDSYSPLYYDRRGKGIGGFNVMEEGESYGCCACIGSAGVALTGLFGVMQTENGLCVNLYQDCVVQTQMNGGLVTLTLLDRLMQDGHVCIKVESNSSFAIRLRVPSWSDTYKVFIDGEKLDVQEKNGYIVLQREWSSQTIRLELDVSLKKCFLNGKIAFMKGPFVLSRDNRLGDKVKRFVNLDKIQSETISNQAFRNNVTIRMGVGGESLLLCDYAQAGKNFDEENCDISVWHDIEI